MCCWLFQLHQRESFSCRSDTAFAYYTLTGDMFSSCATVRVCKWLQLIYLSWQSAPCLVAYPIVSAATKELSESVLQAASIASKGILFLSQWYCNRILHSHRRHVLQRHRESLQMVAADLSELAKCAVPSGLSHHLCCNKRAFRICVAGGFSCIKGDPSLVAVTLHSHITLQFITSNMSSSTM